MLRSITVRNFLRIPYLNIDFTGATMHVVKGDNESGKTSLIDAIRYCLLGEAVRVSLKRDHPMLVHAGEKAGVVGIDLIHMGGAAFRLSRDISSGGLDVSSVPEGVQWNPPAALPYVIDAQSLAVQKPADRRVFLRQLMGITIDKKVVKKRLAERGARSDLIEEITPLLRSGFETAAAYAKRKASEARGAWEVIAGEKYGKRKAEGWEPEKVEPVEDDVLNQQQLAVAQAHAQLEHAREAFGRARLAKEALACPHCKGLVRYAQMQNSSSFALQKYEGGRDEGATVEEAEGELARATHAANLAQEQLTATLQRQALALDAEAMKKEAAQHHGDIGDWSLLADALGPDGVPGQLLTEKLKPLNEHLVQSAQETGWDPVSIRPDMNVLVGDFLYSLASESAQWRADAMLAEAISAFSDLGLLVLDRLDVLQPKVRKSALSWLASKQSQYDLILVCATMESPERGMRNGVMFHRLEGGRAAE